MALCRLLVAARQPPVVYRPVEVYRPVVCLQCRLWCLLPRQLVEPPGEPVEPEAYRPHQCTQLAV